jgi:hypothetical protein
MDLMKVVAILFGVALTILGYFNFIATGADNLWTLVPAFLGLFAILFGILQGRWEHKHALYGVVMIAILTLVSSIRALWNLIILLSGGEPALSGQLIWVRSLRGLLSLLFILLVVVFVEKFWHHWRAFGQFLGDWLGRVVLTIFYFTVFVPFGLGVRIFGDPLHIKSIPAQLWRSRSTGDQTLEDVLRQY